MHTPGQVNHSINTGISGQDLYGFSNDTINGDMWEAGIDGGNMGKGVLRVLATAVMNSHMEKNEVMVDPRTPAKIACMYTYYPSGQTSSWFLLYSDRQYGIVEYDTHTASFEHYTCASKQECRDLYAKYVTDTSAKGIYRRSPGNIARNLQHLSIVKNAVHFEGSGRLDEWKRGRNSLASKSGSWHAMLNRHGYGGTMTGPAAILHSKIWDFVALWIMMTSDPQSINLANGHRISDLARFTHMYAMACFGDKKTGGGDLSIQYRANTIGYWH